MGRTYEKLTSENMKSNLIFSLTILISLFSKAQSIRNDAGFCFGSIDTYASSGGISRGLIVEDLDGDLDKDIVYFVSDLGTNNFRCFKNNLNISYNTPFIPNHFSVPCTSPTTGIDPDNSLTAGDFNADGKIDLAMVDNSNIHIYNNITSSTLSPISFNCAGSYSLYQTSYFSNDNYIDAVDFNNDGTLDLVVIGSDVSSPDILYMEFFKGFGNGTFSFGGSQMVTLPANPNATSINGFNGFQYQVLDYDKDGKKDYVMNNSGNISGLILLKNQSTFTSFSVQPTFISLPMPTNLNVVGFKLEDLNGNLYKDLAITYPSGSNYETVAFINSVATLSQMPSYSSVLSGTVSTIYNKHFVIADFNNDAAMDYYGNEADVYKFIRGISGSPLTSATTAIQMSYNQSSYFQTVTADLDNNGFKDVITIPERSSSDELNIVLNFSYKSVTTPSVTNLTVCAANPINVLNQLLPGTQGLSSIFHNWVQNQSSSVASTPGYTITSPGTYFPKVTATLATSVSPVQTCTFIAPEYTVTAGASPTISYSITPVGTTTNFCVGGQAIISLTGASSYSFNGAAIASSSATTTHTFPINNLTIAYSIIAQNVAGCSTSTNNVIIAKAQPTANINPPLTYTCNNAVVQLTTSAYYPPFTQYSWNNGTYISASVYTLNSSGTKTITLLIKDVNGCISEPVNATVTAYPESTISLTSGNSGSVCPNSFQNYTFSGLSSYSFNPSSGASGINSYSVTIPLNGTSFTVSGNDANGCLSDSVFIIKTFSDNTDLITNSANRVCPGDKVTLSFGGNYLLDWLQYGGTSDPSSITVTPSISTTYSLSITDITTNCKFLKTVLIEVDGGCEVSAGNAVTPNNDNANDIFVINNIERYPDNRVTIYNRYGIEIFKTKGYDNSAIAWPRNADLNTLTSGTYFYIIQLNDTATPIKGWVEILKK
ncbi:MAG: gliding motility-associated C-terminal domain-containing protein [Sediminibacterium sp.]|nr:gliding motility-associated C-terminal domain-containing protein [Sediminibacterium sp.]